MGMLGAVVHVHILNDGTAETVLGKHAFHHFDEEWVIAGLEVLVHRLFLEVDRSEDALATGIAGEAGVGAVGPFLAGELHFIGVDDDYVVAAIYVGRVAGLVFAAKNLGNL